jgi:hypothetical protein
MVASVLKGSAKKLKRNLRAGPTLGRDVFVAARDAGGTQDRGDQIGTKLLRSVEAA